VPAGHRHIAAVFHQGGGDARARQRRVQGASQRHDQSEHRAAHELKQAGVEFRVCGQGLLGKKLDPKTVLPDVRWTSGQ